MRWVFLVAFQTFYAKKKGGKGWQRKQRKRKWPPPTETASKMIKMKN